MHSNRQNRRGSGFSLTELLIVLAVLGTLLALAFPAFTRVVVITRRAQCSKTLKDIGVAYASQLFDATSVAGVDTIHSAVWARQLAPYFGGHRDAFWCTATGKSDGMGYEAVGELPEGVYSLPDAKIRIYNGNSKLYDVDTFTAYPYWLEGTHQDFGRRPGIWKVNATVYDALSRGDMPQYTPGPNSRDYWFIIEDQRTVTDGEPDTAGGDTDFNDFDLHVIQNGIDVTVTGYHKSAGYNFGLVDMEGNVTQESGDMIGPLNLQGVRRLSYGMSTEIHQVAEKARNSSTIIMVDYKDDQVATGDSLAALGSSWDLYRTARHMGQMNALYADGHVRPHRPDEIDPSFTQGETFWDPFSAAE